MAFAALTLTFTACEDESNEPEGACEPGTNVFCRCEGGDSGTRRCQDNGEEFDECLVAPETPCGDRIECEPSSAIFCLCPNDEEGTKECLRDGTGYAECLLAGGVQCPVETTGTSMGGNGSGGNGGAGGATPGECAHDVCASGDPLLSGCDSCATAVCADDDYCCTTAWDVFCVAAADTFCDDICNPVVMCEHDVCVSGGESLTDGCDACVTSVCAADALCCDRITTGWEMGWDTFCVAEVKDGTAHPDCAHLCCEHNECLEGGPLEGGLAVQAGTSGATCSNCANAVCALDSWCCNNEWDQFCVTKAQAEPSCNCP